MLAVAFSAACGKEKCVVRYAAIVRNNPTPFERVRKCAQINIGVIAQFALQPVVEEVVIWTPPQAMAGTLRLLCATVASW